MNSQKKSEIKSQSDNKTLANGKTADQIEPKTDQKKSFFQNSGVHHFVKELKFIAKNGAWYLGGVLAITAIILVVELYSTHRIIPRTEAGGLEIGYLNYQEAKNKLQEKAENYLKTPLVFNYQGQKMEITPAELGVELQVDQTLNNLPIFRFEEEGLADIVSGLVTKREIAFQHFIDTEKALAVVEKKFNLEDKKAKNAHFIFQDKKVGLEPEKSGIALDQKKLFSQLHENIAALSVDPVSLNVQTQNPSITAQELEGKKDQILELLKKPIQLVAGEKKLDFIVMDHLDAVQFDEQKTLKMDGSNATLPVVMADQAPEVSTSVQISLKPSVIEPFLYEKFIKNIEKPTSPAKISTDKDGKVVIEGKAEDGQTVPRDKLYESINLAINRGISKVQVPVVVEKAPITISEDLQKMGIKELLATGHSSYYGSPTNRAFNISVGIKKFNGVIIQPGEEFSFNKTLGEVDGAHGYKLEHVIKSNKVELEYGGGICQVSTTAYRGALLTGLPIDERHEHAWKISYYGQSMGHGLDATIYLGGKDLKFTNDTPGAILIQSYQEDSNAYFKFYGTKDDRQVEMEGPYGGGMNYTWYRHLTKDGKETKEKISSNYHPIPPPEPKPSAPPKPGTPTPTPAANPPAGSPNHSTI